MNQQGRNKSVLASKQARRRVQYSDFSKEEQKQIKARVRKERWWWWWILYTHASAFGVFFITCKRLVRACSALLNCLHTHFLSLSLSISICIYLSLSLSLNFSISISLSDRAASGMYNNHNHICKKENLKSILPLCKLERERRERKRREREWVQKSYWVI